MNLASKEFLEAIKGDRSLSQKNGLVPCQIKYCGSTSRRQCTTVNQGIDRLIELGTNFLGRNGSRQSTAIRTGCRNGNFQTLHKCRSKIRNRPSYANALRASSH